MLDINELRAAVEAAGLNAISREEVLELLDRLEVAEKSDAESIAMYRKVRDERNTYKAAFEEWHQKTGWVQQGINDGSIPPTYLGWHRADVMADMLKSARRDYCVLESHYTALAEELAFTKKRLHDKEREREAERQRCIDAAWDYTFSWADARMAVRMANGCADAIRDALVRDDYRAVASIALEKESK